MWSRSRSKGSRTSRCGRFIRLAGCFLTLSAFPALFATSAWSSAVLTVALVRRENNPNIPESRKFKDPFLSRKATDRVR